ncbi:MAG TPA: hypothetical protein VNT26_20605, partial [Candidatus Sulfotelmatobacter sp.]|nr:hypothetical protein [Candidatus Sulfotelmatobacter sp.]
MMTKSSQAWRGCSVAVLGFLLAASPARAQANSVADAVDPMYGVKKGSCVPGPCLPHASIYPSPNTLGYSTPGYVPGREVVGFAQLHTQGTGGKPSYGNFLISPQIGLQIEEKDHTSPLAEEVAKCYAYQATLARYGIVCEVTPAAHSALYKFTFPASKEAHLVLDAARKIPDGKRLSEVGMIDGTVAIDPATGMLTGGGTFGGNWAPAPYKLYFCAKLSRKPDAVG